MVRSSLSGSWSSANGLALSAVLKCRPARRPPRRRDHHGACRRSEPLASGWYCDTTVASFRSSEDPSRTESCCVAWTPPTLVSLALTSRSQAQRFVGAAAAACADGSASRSCTQSTGSGCPRSPARGRRRLFAAVARVPCGCQANTRGACPSGCRAAHCTPGCRRTGGTLSRTLSTPLYQQSNQYQEKGTMLTMTLRCLAVQASRLDALSSCALSGAILTSYRSERVWVILSDSYCTRVQLLSKYRYSSRVVNLLHLLLCVQTGKLLWSSGRLGRVEEKRPIEPEQCAQRREAAHDLRRNRCCVADRQQDTRTLVLHFALRVPPRTNQY